MAEQIMANIRANIRYMVRNNIIIAIAAIYVIVIAITLLPSFFMTNADPFSMMTATHEAMRGFIQVLLILTAVFMMNDAVKHRYLKMSFTKPHPVELWVFSYIGSLMIVAAVLHTLSLFITGVYSLAFKVPFQAGFAVASLWEFFCDLAAVSYVFLLANIFSPILAFIMYFFLSASVFNYFNFYISTGIKAGNDTFFMQALKQLVTGLYYIIPETDPFRSKLASLMRGYSIDGVDFTYLAAAAGYSLLVFALLTLVSTILLKRKNLS